MTYAPSSLGTISGMHPWAGSGLRSGTKDCQSIVLTFCTTGLDLNNMADNSTVIQKSLLKSTTGNSYDVVLFNYHQDK